VLVSAFIAAGPPSRIIEKAIDGRLGLVLPEPVMEELERILTAKLGFDSRRWGEVEALLAGLAVELVPAAAELPPSVTGDRDDDLILACALKAKVEILVSGDHKHQLPLQTCGGMRIVTPQALLAELTGRAPTPPADD
jgi:uncharacterized protein